jgi:hypothetical protein
MKTKIPIIVIFILLTNYNFLVGQEINEDNYKFKIVGVDGNIGIPRGIFSKNLDQAAFGGVNIHLLKQYQKDNPFFIGGGISYNYLAGAFAVIPRTNISGIEELWDGRTSSSMVKFYATGRYYIDVGNGKITPYFQTNLGWNWLYTLTTFTFPDSDESTTDFEKNDIAFSYSGSLGANYAIDYNWHINVSMSFENGQSSFYYVKRDEDFIPQFSPVEKMEIKKSLTNYVGIAIGVAYRW